MQQNNSAKMMHARHLAYQILSQLPEEPGEAILILECAKQLLLQPFESQTAPIATLKLVEKDHH